MLPTVEKLFEDNSQEGKKKKLQELSLRGKNAKVRGRNKKKEELENPYKSLMKCLLLNLQGKFRI